MFLNLLRLVLHSDIRSVQESGPRALERNARFVVRGLLSSVDVDVSTWTYVDPCFLPDFLFGYLPLAVSGACQSSSPIVLLLLPFFSSVVNCFI